LPHLLSNTWVWTLIVDLSADDTGPLRRQRNRGPFHSAAVVRPGPIPESRVDQAGTPTTEMRGTDPWAVGFALPWTDPRCGRACALLLAGGGPGPYGRFHFGAGPVCCTSARVPIGSGSTEETVAPGSSLAIRTSTMNGRPSLCLSTPGKGRLACRFPRFGSIRSVDEKRRYTSLRQKPCVYL
jgi:hypothetical protein